MTYLDSELRPQHPEGLTANQEELALELFDIGVIKVGGFKIKLHQNNPDAPLSPVYFDFKVLSLHPETLAKVGNVYKELAQNAQDYDACLGIPDGGIPLGTAFALNTGTPQVILRKESKQGHGIEGKFFTSFDISKYRRVLVLDDLITTAASKIETLDILNEAGLEVKDILVILDRDQTGKGKQALKERGVNFHSAYTLDPLLNFFVRVGKITPEQYQDINTRLAQLAKYIA